RDRAPGGAPRHASIAHRRQRASNPRLGRGDESIVHGGLAVPEQAGGKCRGSGNSDKQFARDGHFLTPAGVPGGSSSNSMITVESSATLLASAGGLNAKSPSGLASVFQSLIFSVYWGAPVTVLLVITHLRGTGFAPGSIQICQSVSGPRNARCSHSTPSTTPCPICLPSITLAIN